MNIRNLANYSSVALTNSAQPQTQIVIDPSYGDVVGFTFDLSVATTGTLVSPTKVTRAISQVVIVDRNGNTLMQLEGKDLDKIAYLMSGRGNYTSPSDNSNSAVAWNSVIPFNIAMKDQPAKAIITFASYSSLASSGATGATLNLKVEVLYGNSKGITNFISVAQLNLTSGTNTYSSSLANMKKVVKMGFSVGSESNINHLNFSPDGKVDVYNSQTLQALKDLDDEFKDEGHPSGIIDLYTGVFEYSTASSRFVINGAGSDTISVYQIGEI